MRERGTADGAGGSKDEVEGALEPLKEAICAPFAVVSGLRPVKGQGRASLQGVVTSLCADLRSLLN